jgi:predicted phage terminase large subunit-like protein
MSLGLRLGDPKCVITTTPRPISLLKELIKSPTTHTTRGSTFDNRSNLAEAFFDTVVSRYEGTSIGRQELYAEILDELPGALWSRRMIEEARVSEAPSDLARIVVAVDPAITANKNSDETGIVVCGLSRSGQFYILEDVSGRYSVEGWSRCVVDCYNRWGADRVVAEVNQGGDMVERVIRQSGDNVAYRGVHASRAKFARAEPVASRYEQGKVSHVGFFSELEDQLCSYSQLSSYSPDRLDALVWGITELDSRQVVDIAIDVGSGHAPRAWI